MCRHDLDSQNLTQVTPFDHRLEEIVLADDPDEGSVLFHDGETAEISSSHQAGDRQGIGSRRADRDGILHQLFNCQRLRITCCYEKFGLSHGASLLLTGWLGCKIG